VLTTPDQAVDISFGDDVDSVGAVSQGSRFMTLEQFRALTVVNPGSMLVLVTVSTDDTPTHCSVTSRKDRAIQPPLAMTP
jgi:hypothetical protein